MKIIEAIKNDGRPFEIIGEGRNELPEFCKEMGFKVGAEIGSHHGEFTKKFCEAGFAMFAIDPWTSYFGAGRSETRQDKQDYNYEQAQKNLAPYDCKLLRKTSMEALKDFDDGELDFVYIDGDHSFLYAAEDIVEWSKKVKSGGVVSGHDYFNTQPQANNVLCHVKAVLDAYPSVYDINFYTLIKENPTDKDDKTPTWFMLAAAAAQLRSVAAQSKRAPVEEKTGEKRRGRARSETEG